MEVNGTPCMQYLSLAQWQHRQHSHNQTERIKINKQGRLTSHTTLWLLLLKTTKMKFNMELLHLMIWKNIFEKKNDLK
jgi:hypothetical protein